MKKQMEPQVGDYLKAVTNEMTFGEARESTRKELLSHIEDNIVTALSYGVARDVVVLRGDVLGIKGHLANLDGRVERIEDHLGLDGSPARPTAKRAANK